MVELGRSDHLAVTPDGPRGPRRQVQPGLIYVAARTGLPIIPIGISFRRAWRMRSWDQFALPRPFTLGTCVTLSPIHVPNDMQLGQLDHYRKLVENAMKKASQLADHWAATGDQPSALEHGDLAA